VLRGTVAAARGRRSQTREKVAGRKKNEKGVVQFPGPTRIYYSDCFICLNGIERSRDQISIRKSHNNPILSAALKNLNGYQVSNAFFFIQQRSGKSRCHCHGLNYKKIQTKSWISFVKGIFFNCCC
jgi:hypothetical protein